MIWNAVILAAGRGRRMGGPKAMMEIRGSTLLDLQVRALGGAAKIAVVLSEELWEALSRADIGAGKPLPQGESALKGLPQLAEFVLNTRVEEGPFTSIRLGLEALDDAPALIVPVDCPVPLEAPGHLLRAVAPGLAWVAPTQAGRRGHPVLLTSTGRTLALEAGQGVTLRDLLSANPGAEIPVDSPLVYLNLNTPADRDRFLADHFTWPNPPMGATP